MQDRAPELTRREVGKQHRQSRIGQILGQAFAYHLRPENRTGGVNREARDPPAVGRRDGRLADKGMNPPRNPLGSGYRKGFDSIVKGECGAHFSMRFGGSLDRKFGQLNSDDDLTDRSLVLADDAAYQMKEGTIMGGQYHLHAVEVAKDRFGKCYCKALLIQVKGSPLQRQAIRDDVAEKILGQAHSSSVSECRATPSTSYSWPL